MEQVWRKVPHYGSQVGHFYFIYVFISFIDSTSDMWGHVAPQGCHLITWPVDLTTTNRSACYSEQNKLVRSVEQTSKTCVEYKNPVYLSYYKICW